MLVHLHLPGALRPYAGGRRLLDLAPSGSSVAELLEALGGACPGVHHRVVNEAGSLRPHVNVFVNGENIRHLSGLATPLEEGDEVWLLPAVSGGQRVLHAAADGAAPRSLEANVTNRELRRPSGLRLE